jgi:hypothetical protein
MVEAMKAQVTAVMENITEKTLPAVMEHINSHKQTVLDEQESQLEMSLCEYKSPMFHITM